MNIEVEEIRDSRQRENHGDRSTHKDNTSSPSIDEIPWRYSRDKIRDTVDSRHQDGVSADPSCGFEYVWRVVGDDVDAVELREGLGGHGDEDTGSVTAEHVTVGLFTFLPG